MRRLSEFIKLLDEYKESEFDIAFNEDVLEMVNLGYQPDEAIALLARQIKFHAALLKEKN
jgi:hypothetical protein